MTFIKKLTILCNISENLDQGSDEITQEEIEIIEDLAKGLKKKVLEKKSAKSADYWYREVKFGLTNKYRREAVLDKVHYALNNAVHEGLIDAEDICN